MGRKRLHIDGEPREIEESTTVGELKRRDDVGFSTDDMVVYHQGDDSFPLNDNDSFESVPEDSRVSSYPNKTRYVG